MKNKLITRSVQLHPIIWEYINNSCETYGGSQSKFIRDSVDSIVRRKVYNELIDIYAENPRVGDPDNKILQKSLMDMTATQMIERLKELKSIGQV